MQMGPVLLPTPLSPARGLLFRRTMEKRLAPDVIASNGLEACFTGARTGIRSHFPAVSVHLNRNPSQRRLPSGGSET